MSTYLIDADSLVFRAGCSGESRYYLLLTAEGDVIGTYKAKADASAVLQEGCTLVRHKEFVDGVDTEQATIIAKGRLNEMMGVITNRPDCESFRVYIGGTGNFRRDLYADYKANRDDFSRPLLEDVLRGHLVQKYGAMLCHGEEAEDVVAYTAVAMGRGAIMAHIDKDLNTVPGEHFNYVTGELSYIAQEQADLTLYRQILTGDSTDNIPGIQGVGQARAEKLLPTYTSPSAMWGTVVGAYTDAGYTHEYALLMARLVYIRRYAGEMWQPPADFIHNWVAA